MFLLDNGDMDRLEEDKFKVQKLCENLLGLTTLLIFN